MSPVEMPNDDTERNARNTEIGGPSQVKLFRLTWFTVLMIGALGKRCVYATVCERGLGWTKEVVGYLTIKLNIFWDVSSIEF